MQLRIFTEPQQGATYDQLLAVARLGEELGFDGFFRSDHYLKMGDVSGLPGPSDAWITLAGLARDTSTIRLGTMVTPITFRHPGPLAISVANVDAMSGGRVELGLGAGWYDDEHHAYAIPYPPLGERFERLEEQLAIITGLWSTPVGETFTYQGRHHSVTDSPALPKPAQAQVPVIIGGGGKVRTPRLAARYASEFNHMFSPPDALAATRERVEAACSAIDRDPASMTWGISQVACVGADEVEVTRRAAAIGRQPEELRANGVAGTVAEAAERLALYAEHGITRAYLQVLDLDDLDHLRALAQLL
ncbi:MAG: LLM class F420-dependent oxidoreductase [Acidimicrobiales bacterium]|nr:LLM class F420-dependent oxidoreductase [Acidimicrobiales bacterium]